MNRDRDYDRFERTDREIGRYESPLGEAMEMTAFPRRKKKPNYSWVIVLAIVVGLAAGFVVYAMSQPEEAMFAGVQDTPAPFTSVNALTDDSEVGELDSDPEAASSQSAGMPIAASSYVSNNDAASNPLAIEMQIVEDFWSAASANVNARPEDEALSWILPLDVAHADIWEHIDPVMSLAENQGAWLDPSGQIDGTLEPSADTPDQYLYAVNVMKDDQKFLLRGKVDTARHAVMSVVKNEEGKTLRLFESVRVNNAIFVQLLAAEGPYKGALYFQFMESGAVRCAYMDAGNYVAPASIFPAAPTSWEDLTANATLLFMVGAPANADVAAQPVSNPANGE